MDTYSAMEHMGKATYLSKWNKSKLTCITPFRDSLFCVTATFAEWQLVESGKAAPSVKTRVFPYSKDGFLDLLLCGEEGTIAVDSSSKNDGETLWAWLCNKPDESGFDATTFRSQDCAAMKFTQRLAKTTCKTTTDSV